MNQAILDEVKLQILKIVFIGFLHDDLQKFKVLQFQAKNHFQNGRDNALIFLKVKLKLLLILVIFRLKS